MKKFKILMGAGLSLTVLFFVFTVTIAAPISLRYAHVSSSGIQLDYADELAKRINEQTEGRIKIDVYPSSQLGGISETIDGIRTGSIHMSQHDFASLARFVPDLGVFTAPYLYKSASHALRAGNPKTSPVLARMNEELIEKGNMRILGSFYRGARQLTTKFPVYSPEDLKGRKIRGLPNKLWNVMLEGMGAIPTPVEWAEVPTALMTGLAEGQENPLESFYNNNLFEVQSHVILTTHMISTLCVFINEDTWQSIPENDQKIIEDIIMEMEDWSVQRIEKVESDLIERIEAEGVEVIGKEEGLDLEAFETSVLKELKKAYPEWEEYIKEIQAME